MLASSLRRPGKIRNGHMRARENIRNGHMRARESIRSDTEGGFTWAGAPLCA